MKVTVITVCFNSEKSIRDTIISVNMQSHSDIEHIFIDGLSSDGTIDLIRNFSTRQTKVISERDGGIYDAMNKGVAFATGDIICFLNSDDIFYNKDIILDVALVFEIEFADFVYGDLEMYDHVGNLVRSWHTGISCKELLRGKQIPHPAFFVKKNLLLQLKPPFDSSYRIAADLKQQIILINKLKSKGAYLERPLVKMAIGGVSTQDFSSYINGWKESVRAYNDVFGSGGILFTIKKVLSKLSGTNIFKL